MPAPARVPLSFQKLEDGPALPLPHPRRGSPFSLCLLLTSGHLPAIMSVGQLPSHGGRGHPGPSLPWPDSGSVDSLSSTPMPSARKEPTARCHPSCKSCHHQALCPHTANPSGPFPSTLRCHCPWPLRCFGFNCSCCYLLGPPPGWGPTTSCGLWGRSGSGLESAQRRVLRVLV